jgi:ABC-type transport system involved in multi-copper enzyme maturation permease subunit
MTGFYRVLHAEWTKFRTVRGWLVAAVVGGLIIVLFGLLTGAASRSSYTEGPGKPEIVGHPPIPIGPDGEAVVDTFYFVHQPLTGDGSVTVHVNSLSSKRHNPNTGVDAIEVQPWAKAGVMVKAGTTPGSPYAAVMTTGGHGARMQYNFTHDIAGPVSANWLRLTRSGSTLTGYASADGQTWTQIGSSLGPAGTVQIGVFSTSPFYENSSQHIGGGGKVVGGPTLLTATFDSLTVSGASGNWQGDAVGYGPDSAPIAQMVGFEQSGDSLTVTGSGNVAPAGGGDAGTPIERLLAGAFAGLTVIVVLAALFVTSEYRRGLIRTTFAATPGRGQVLVAKAIVAAGVSFVAGLVGAGAAIPLSVRLLVKNGNAIYPTGGFTETRLVVGTAAVLAVASVLAVALGALLRRGVGAVASVIVLIVLPYILAVAAVLPAGPSQWLLRVTPAAGFAVQQSLAVYSQVDATYTPAFGYFPLAPWAGFAVLCAYAALALGAALVVVRRRDA